MLRAVLCRRDVFFCHCLHVFLAKCSVSIGICINVLKKLFLVFWRRTIVFFSDGVILDVWERKVRENSNVWGEMLFWNEICRQWQCMSSKGERQPFFSYRMGRVNFPKGMLAYFWKVTNNKIRDRLLCTRPVAVLSNILSNLDWSSPVVPQLLLRGGRGEKSWEDGDWVGLLMFWIRMERKRWRL